MARMTGWLAWIGGAFVAAAGAVVAAITGVGRFLADLPTRVGKSLGDFLAYVGGVALLGVEAVRLIPIALLARRARLGRESLAFQIVRVGVYSIPVVFLVSIFIGVILALTIAPELNRYGAESEAPRIIALGILRELGPLISALILAGYAGAAIAAELGTMVVGEEIDALVAGATDPVRFLVVPRVVATLTMVALLAVLADWLGVLGGFLTAVYVLRQDPGMFVSRILTTVSVADFLSGIVKSVAFGGIIGLVACFEGLRVSGGAEGVGKATTQTVVRAGVCIIAADCFFTAAFYTLGISS